VDVAAQVAVAPPATVLAYLLMHSRRLRLRALALCAALSSQGCGLVDPGDQQEERALTWCSEPASAEVAEVLVSSKDGGSVVSSVILLEAQGEMIAWVQQPDDPERVRRFDYVRDTDGNVTEETLDEGTDGTVEKVTTTIYDEDGQSAGRTVDHDGDGVVDESFVWVYSIPGEVSVVQDIGLDGQADSIQITTLSDDGTEPRRVDEDTDADGTVDASTTYSYTDSGQLRELDIDSDGDLVPDVIVLNEYDEAGRLTRSYQVSDEETVPSFSETYEYDEEGRLVFITYDESDDRVADRSTRMYYDDEGRRVREERTTFENSEASRSVVEYEYGTGTEADRISTDDNDDGSWDSLQTRTACGD